MVPSGKTLVTKSASLYIKCLFKPKISCLGFHRHEGRIAQLVELLSYTQAVIGSSPVAPMFILYAGVVQLVRAPACHAGSCGFEPRLPRMLFYAIQRLNQCLQVLIPILFLACSSHSAEDFYDEGQGIVRTLIEELKTIHTRDQLLTHAPGLKKLFNSLVDVLMSAHKYREDSLSDREHILSDSLRQELERVYRIEGGRDIIEKCQEEALNRLDASVKK